MNELKMKAKAGVTLVELLVVILIVTILSVSMLPLLKPFVVEAQYAAEAIPVIGNLRTKIGLYQYDKGKLPECGGVAANAIETWGFTVDGATIVANESDTYLPGYRTLAATAVANAIQPIVNPPEATDFVGARIDIDNQDLAGKRCKPVHFQYAVLANGSSYCYVIGCFGDNNGLPEGTGYAVCEISVKADDGNVYKHVGTWKRYKAATDGQMTFGTITAAAAQPEVAKKASVFCAVPAAATFAQAPIANAGKLALVEWMESYGWEF